MLLQIMIKQRAFRALHELVAESIYFSSERIYQRVLSLLPCISCKIYVKIFVRISSNTHFVFFKTGCYDWIVSTRSKAHGM
jgi:hypothetical protein